MSGSVTIELIKQTLEEYKTANLYSETVRDRLADDIYNKIKGDDSPRYVRGDDNEDY